MKRRYLKNDELVHCWHNTAGNQNPGRDEIMTAGEAIESRAWHTWRGTIDIAVTLANPGPDDYGTVYLAPIGRPYVHTGRIDDNRVRDL